MITQLVQTGLLARAAAVVIGELPKCDEPSGDPTARAVMADLFADFPGPGAVWLSVRPHDGAGHDAAVRRRLSRRRRLTSAPGHRGGGGPVTTRIHLIGVCGTAMATLAAMLKRKGYDVRGSDQDVYPPMSDFLASEGILALSGYRAEHITGDLDLRHRGQRRVARESGTRGSPRPQDSVLFVTRGHPRAFSVGRPFDRPCGNPRQDDHHVAHGLAAHLRRPRPEHARWRHRAKLRRTRVELPAGAGP